MNTIFLQRAKEITPWLIDIRRTIHRHPELGFEEYQTAALIADTLQTLGINSRTGIGKTGVVGYLGGDRPVVALRADIDALPIQEANQSDYASEIAGVMHACGHDVHTACLLGAARILQGMELTGQVRLIFQPSEEGMDEEGKSGARRLIEEGALDNVEAIFALHVDGKYEAGTFACSPGYIMAAMDNFTITVRGVAAHAAQAFLGVDAILLAAQVINTLHTIISRRIAPTENGVISIGTIIGGTKENNLADEVEMRGTIRSFNPKVRQKLIDEIHRACSVAKMLGGDYQLTITEGYPALSNDPLLVSFFRKTAVGLFGEKKVEEIEPEMGSEDFSFYMQGAPGCYFTLGSRRPGGRFRPLHHPDFDIDESILPLGAAIMAQLAVNYLEQGPLLA